MPPYNGPSKERSLYSSKFIRVARDIFVTLPENLDTTHANLARLDGILDRLKSVKLINPDEIDAGYFSVIDKEIVVASNSLSLGILEREKAREITLKDFSRLSSGYIVRKTKTSRF